MKSLERRLIALEGVGGDDTFAHLTDEELRERMIGIVEQVAGAGVPVPDGWREMIYAKDYRALGKLIGELKCEILSEG